MRLLGLTVHRSDDRDPVSKRLQPLLHKFGIRHVLDVGANTGQFGRRMRDEARFLGRLDSFEPSEAAHAKLARASSDDPEWHAHRLGLSSGSGRAILNLHDDTSLNSLAATTNAGASLFRSWGRSQRGMESVPLARLDEVALPDLGPTLLKLDTQGHDFSVLEGAGMVLDRTVLILIELSFIPLYASSVPASEAFTRLDALGFGLVDLYPITRDESRQVQLVEGDGLFVRV